MRGRKEEEERGERVEYGGDVEVAPYQERLRRGEARGRNETSNAKHQKN
jgi:hypothetical protein